MKILITGIHGFLGKHIFQRLRHDHTIAGLARGRSVLEGVPVYSSENLEEFDFDPHIVIMCHAAVSSGRDEVSLAQLFDSNVLLTEKICKKFTEAKIIYISTVSIYAISDQPIIEESATNPISNYAVSKLWGEKIVHQHKNSSILRVSSMYGNGMKPNTIIPNYVEHAISEGEISVWGDGSRHQNYVHVSDVVGYIEAIIKNYDKQDKTLFLGVGTNENSNLELAEIIAKKTGAKIVFVHKDRSVSFKYDNSFTIERLGVEPKMSLQEGLEKYIACERKKY